VTLTFFWLAALLPALLALTTPPSPTLLNQAAAWACWGLVAIYATRLAVLPSALGVARSAPLSIWLLLVVIGALLTWLTGALPPGLAWSGAATALAASALAVLGAAMAPLRMWRTYWLGAWAAIPTPPLNLWSTARL
jgi:hypothetical protein